MSKVTIEIDTEVGNMNINVDGQAIDGITDLSVYIGEDYDGEKEARVYFAKQEKQGEMRVSTNYCVAQAKGAAKASITETDPNYKVQEGIRQFYKNRRK